jgi:AAHS family 4-hydroxybenzoate transporter-like MFS transporter
VLKETGVALNTTFRLTGAFSAGGVIAILLLGPIVDRLGATTVVTCLFAAAAIAVIGIGWSGGSVPWLAVTIVVAGGCVTAGQSFCNILAAALYPTTMRSTGIAWALGVGRAGTMLGPIVGSLLLTAKIAPAAILYSTAIPAAIAAVAILLLGRRMRIKPTASGTLVPTQN